MDESTPEEKENVRIRSLFFQSRSMSEAFAGRTDVIVVS
jgi:hypothetical protein